MVISVLMENQQLIGMIVKLQEETGSKFFWSNIHLRGRSALNEVNANIERVIFAVALCAHL